MFRPITSVFLCALTLLAAAPQPGPVITTIAGGGPDQLRLVESQVAPCSLAFDGSGDLFISSDRNRIFRVDAAGVVYAFAGSGGLFPTKAGAGEGSGSPCRREWAAARRGVGNPLPVSRSDPSIGF